MEKYNNELDFRRFIREIKRLKWVYLAAFIILISGGIIYYLRSMPKYQAMGEVLIEDSSDNSSSMPSGSLSSAMRSFSLGGFGSSSADNEIAIMQSNKLRRRIIRNLKLNRIYVERDGLKKRMLYDDTPVLLDAAPELFDTLSTSFTVHVTVDKGKVSAKATQGRIFKKIIGEVKNSAFPCILHTEYGDFSLVKNTGYSPEKKLKIDIVVMGDEVASKILSEELYMEITDAKTDIIAVSYRSPNRVKAMVVIDAVMKEYNVLRMERSHSNAAQEMEYFKSRLDVVESNLIKSEAKLEEFLRDNSFVGGDIIVEQLVNDTAEKKEALIKMQAQIDYYEEVLKLLNSNSSELIPVVDAAENPAIESYNAAIVKRKNLEVSATSENKSLQVLNDQIDYLRGFIKSNVELMLRQAKVNIASLKHLNDNISNKMDKLPETEREYVELLREQKFNSELYLFILQKKESAELKFYSNSTLGFVIEDAYCDIKPKNTIGMMVLILAILASVILPTGLAVVLLMFKRKVDMPMDLTRLGLENNSELYTGTKLQLSSFRQKLLDSDKKVFYVMDYAGSASMKDKLIAEFKNIEKNVIWFDSLKENDQIFTRSFKSHLDELQSKYDMVFVTIPEKEILHTISSQIASEKNGVLLIIESGKVSLASLKKDLENLDKETVYTLIIGKEN